MERNDCNFILKNRHRACNIFARTYYELWLQEENIGQEVMIEDLTVFYSHLKLRLDLFVRKIKLFN